LALSDDSEASVPASSRTTYPWIILQNKHKWLIHKIILGW